MQSVRLDKIKHNRKRFDCGIESLNNYLKMMASQQAGKDNTRTFVIEDKARPESIIGFYSLAMVSLNTQSLPTTLQKKHFAASSAGLIARLAVDKKYQGDGYGEWLLIDSLKRLLAASDSVAFPLVIVDAKDGAATFYQQYGFTLFQDEESKLFITIADIRESIGS